MDELKVKYQLEIVQRRAHTYVLEIFAKSHVSKLCSTESDTVLSQMSLPTLLNFTPL